MWNFEPAQRSAPTLIFAHRGASHAAPQNTLAAFRKAAEVGADGVELDVQLSADGVPVVIHDMIVDATTDGSGRVREMSLMQLKQLDAGGYFSDSTGGRPFVGERIPTLEEVFAEIGDQLLINVELKSFSERGDHLERAVVDLVGRMGMQDRVLFSSFKPYTLYQLNTLAPEIPRGLLYSPLSLGTLFLAPFTPYDALHPHTSLVTPGFVQRVHRRGLHVAAWTLDDEALAVQLAAWGVDIIITNEPAKLVAAFADL